MREQLIVRLAIHSGMRPREIIALQWKHVPATYNPRKDLKPGDEQYEKLRAAIDRFDLVELDCDRLFQ